MNNTNTIIIREAFKLYEFDIQELEESFLLFGTDDESDDLVLQLLVSLLRGCIPTFKKRIDKEVKTIFTNNLKIFFYVLLLEF